MSPVRDFIPSYLSEISAKSSILGVETPDLERINLGFKVFGRKYDQGFDFRF